MSSPFDFTPLKKSDYGADGLGSKDALDKFFTQMNTTMQSLQQTLGGGLDFTNLNGQAWEITLTTPNTDWVTVTPDAAWTVDEAVQWRRDSAGTVWWQGRVNSGGAIPGLATLVVTLPTGAFPSTSGAKRMPIIAKTAATRGTAQIDVDSGGTMKFTASSSIAGAAVTEADLYFSYPGTAPGVLSCFPVNVRVQDGKKVKGVFTTAIIDSDQASAPAVTPGPVAFVQNQTKPGFPNSFSLVGIAGLALGRTYSIRGVALFA